MRDSSFTAAEPLHLNQRPAGRWLHFYFCSYWAMLYWKDQYKSVIDFVDKIQFQQHIPCIFYFMTFVYVCYEWWVIMLQTIDYISITKRIIYGLRIQFVVIICIWRSQWRSRIFHTQDINLSLNLYFSLFIRPSQKLWSWLKKRGNMIAVRFHWSPTLSRQ